MSTYTTRNLISTTFESKRKFAVDELANDKNLSWTTASATRYFSAHMYSNLQIRLQYFTYKFMYADITITNRFTMDSYSYTIDFSNCKLDDTTTAVYNDFSTYSGSKAYLATINNIKYNVVDLAISAFDFYYGDVYVLFRGSDTSKKPEYYMDPVTVQFTNAPTVYSHLIYETNDGNSKNDNVFTDTDDSKSLLTAIREDVLTGDDCSEYYNSFLQNERLYTNGSDTIANLAANGHPLYKARYNTIVPTSLSTIYGTADNSIGFTVNKAYLACDESTADDNITLNVTNVVDTTANYACMCNADGKAITASNLNVHAQSWLVNLAKTNSVSDKQLRTHTTLNVDFALSGIDSKWL